MEDLRDKLRSMIDSPGHAFLGNCGVTKSFGFCYTIKFLWNFM